MYGPGLLQGDSSVHGGREVACAPVVVPAGMAGDVAGYSWARNLVGESGGRVFRLFGRVGAPDLYLKQGRGAVAGAIADEAARLSWLSGRVAVPAVRRFLVADDGAWLLMTAVPGVTAWQLLEGADAAGRGAIVDALADFLRGLHAIPVGDCPFASGHEGRMAQARARIAAGLVDAADFDAERQGWTAEQVWDALCALLPMSIEPVVTHGDYSLDNILLVDGAVAGCIDVGRAGVADRYQDLAILWNCLGEYGAALQARFLRRYGVVGVDGDRLAFHLLLDELF
jgi:aminoglycoside 3'-phosphotransferase-1